MSSSFTQMATSEPPLIGALLRIPLDRVHSQILRALHAHGFADITSAHFQVLRWPGPNGQRPSNLPSRAA